MGKDKKKLGISAALPSGIEYSVFIFLIYLISLI